METWLMVATGLLSGVGGFAPGAAVLLGSPRCGSGAGGRFALGRPRPFPGRRRGEAETGGSPVGEGVFGGLTVIASVVAYLFGKWSEQKRADRKDTLDEVWKYVAELKGAVERRDAVLEQHGRAVELFSRQNADCREEAAELRQAVHFLHGSLERAYAQLRKLGHDPGDLPELPPPRQRQPGPDPEFVARQAQHSAGLLKQASGAFAAPPPPGTPPPS